MWLRVLMLLLTALMAASGLVVGVVVALGVAWIAVAIPVLILIGLGTGVVALRHRLGGHRPRDPASEKGPGTSQH